MHSVTAALFSGALHNMTGVSLGPGEILPPLPARAGT